MRSALFSFVSAAIIAAVLTPVVRVLAYKFDVVDRPGGRRIHGKAIPRLGGIAVAIAFFVPLIAIFIADTGLSRILFADPMRAFGLLIGSVLVVCLGLWDDVKGVGAGKKLAIQILAAAIAYAAGFRVDAVSLPIFGRVDFGVFSGPLTVLWIVAIINALNLIDGLDGLAAGIAFFACVTNFVVATINMDAQVMALSATLGGAVLGFLFYNFNPASIFMGDSGSMLLGYVLATSAILGSSIKSSTTVAILAPVVALGVPIVDTLLVMIRRVLEKRSIFTADKGHVHHRLLELGLTHRRAVLILYGMSVLFTGVAITVAIGRSWQVGAAMLVLTVAVIGFVRFLGYIGGQNWLLVSRHATQQRYGNARKALQVLLLELEQVGGSRDLDLVLRKFGDATGITSLRVERAVDEPEVNGKSAPDTRSLFPPSRAVIGAMTLVIEGEDQSWQSQSMRTILDVVADSVAHTMNRLEGKPPDTSVTTN